MFWKGSRAVPRLTMHLCMLDLTCGPVVAVSMDQASFQIANGKGKKVLCVGVGEDRTHAGPLQKSRVCPP